MPRSSLKFEARFVLAKKTAKLGGDPTDASAPPVSRFVREGETLLLSVNIHGHFYDFWQAGGTSDRDLEKDVWIKGPAYDHPTHEWSDFKTALGVIRKDGRIRYMIGPGDSDKTSREQLDKAIEGFWRQMGLGSFKTETGSRTARILCASPSTK